MSSRAWHVARPELAERIRRDLTAEYPSLHLFVEAGRAFVRGTFPVVGPGGGVLDRFQVSIELPARFPHDLPITRETGGRIPWTPQRHVDPDGTACVLLPDERWRVFPVDAPFIDYLKGPLHSYFLGQIIVEQGKPWPFGEWAHGGDGVIDFYAELLGTRDLVRIASWLVELERPKMQGHRRCPCASGKRIQECCIERLEAIRAKIDVATATRSLSYVALGLHQEQMLRQRLTRVTPVTSLIHAAGSPRGLGKENPIGR